ncbi:MAG TPA: hypothetical protein VHV32_19025 [Candidatus Angelobacter sp.]|jgi:hypothetical protein|nr:hypothetical protein [Candidatus Angelobacter sp.]
MLIKRKIGADKEGKGGRTLYYKAYSAEGRPMMGSKNVAADMPPETAELVAGQLNQLHGGGFEVV